MARLRRLSAFVPLWTLALAGFSLADAPVRDAPRPPFVCRARLSGPEVQRAALAGSSWFEEQPETITPEILRNPLFADELDIEVENTSGGRVAVYAWSPDAAFDVRTEIRDARGKLVTFPHAGPSGIKRLGPIRSTPTRTVDPGQKLRPPGSIFSYHLNRWDVPPPGRYRCTVIVSYFRTPDGKDVSVESEPIAFELTARDIAAWKAMELLKDGED